MRKQDLLYGLMIRSGNDAANALAVIDAGSVEAFVERMNAKARELGMYESNFANPHGYHDENHYTTAYDLSLAARTGLTDPEFCRIVTCLEYTLPPTKKRDALPIHNTYEIFDPESPYYLPYAAGVKSGFTSAAGFCFVGAAQKDGRTLIAVILGAPSRNAAWTDLRRLYEYGFALEP
jgi:D-alanyl-D-alanine carboxypeptidase (penicillin-binding protein 5/6)